MNQHLNFLLKCIIVAFTFSAVSGYSQSLTIHGKIIDKYSKEAIPFVNVRNIQSNASAVADLNGYFSMIFSKGTDNISFSCMGYRPITIAGPNPGKEITVEMEQDVIQLQTVDVKPLNPVAIIKEAMQRIPENYGIDTTAISGYYHNFTLLDDKNLRYTEAFIDVYKPPFIPHDNKKNVVGDSILVKEVRTKPSEFDDWKIMMLTPWELGIHLLQGRDVARDFTSSVMSEGFVGSYHFELEDMVNMEGRPTYKILLAPRKNKKTGIWNGHLYIDEETKAFVKIDFKSSPKLFKRVISSPSYIMVTNLYKFHYKEGEWREVIQYKLQDGIWYLDEVNSGKNFIVNSKKRNMDYIPLVQKLHYKTADFIKKTTLPDSGFLSHDLGKADKYFEANYRQEFWRTFDKSMGIETDDHKYGLKNTFAESKPYQFSRLDTLKGSLTQLRTAFDVGYYHLDVEVFPDAEEILGSSLIRFKLVEPTDKIQIDLYSGMKIDSIIYRAKHLDFEREYDAVYVSFEKQLERDSIEEIKVYFGGRPLDFDPLTPMYASFLWFTDNNGNPWIQAICQGYGASGWWPNKDHLSDEPDSVTISITNPSDLVAVSNGRLVDKMELENDRTRTTWHVSYPINNYNITLNLGNYEQIKRIFPSLDGELDVEYHVMDYHLDNVASKYETTGKALNTFEKYFGPYPFPRDGIKFIEAPHAMEHQSAVALGFEYFQDDESEGEKNSIPDFGAAELPDQILIHEFAHEWWGNSVSCTDNAELWIHEAFATYAEALYIEEQYSYEESLVYLNAMKPSISNKHPVIGNFGVNHVHYNIWDMYAKGALFLNTLRHIIDDNTLWFDIIKGIPRDFKYQSINTDQILEYFNQKTGKELRPIFDQYLRLAEIPVLEFEMKESPSGNMLQYRWKANAEGFAMPISYQLSSGEKQWLQPNSDWHELGLDELNIFEVDFNTDMFYIEVRNNSK
ncbi:M1 family aminopeptidase [Pararhodonellum marinum]|uniref:M1 family aminopeptidase n=1 Tax=Pararhodonellum marinum TaxID=2755358 RepID=UPI00188EDB77|nr:M1 family aminopeptidase [Pararhodonellum marinum]